MAGPYNTTGTTVTFGTSGYSGELTDINGPGMSLATINKSHLGSTGWHEYMAATLIEGGEYTIEGHFDPALDFPIIASTETVTITWSDGTSYDFDGIVTGFDMRGPLEDKMTCTITVKVAGEITQADTSSTTSA